MEAVILVIHLILALAIIGLVLLQRSEGGGLGIGGGGGGLGNLAGAQGTANALTKATAFCAMAFFGTSLLLGILAGHNSQQRQGILATMEAEEQAADEQDLQTITIEEDGSVTGPEPSAPIAE